MKMWSQLLGDKSRFSMRLDFRPDPDAGAGAPDDDAASWGSFEIWVQGINLCAHYDEGERHDSVHWYLLPMLEWFADYWEPVFHEERLPSIAGIQLELRQLHFALKLPAGLDDEASTRFETRAHDWWQRHCLQAARCGGPFPNVVLRRWRNFLEISWEDAQLPGMPDSFSFSAPHGSARLRPEDVAIPLYRLLSNAVDYLSNRLPKSRRIKRLSDTVAALERPDREKRLAWMAGLGYTQSEDQRRWQEVRGVFSKQERRAAEAVKALLATPLDLPLVLGSCEATLMFGSASPALSSGDISTLAGKLVELFDEGGDRTPLKKLAKDEPLASDQAEPWDQGYELALNAHQLLGKWLASENGKLNLDQTIRNLGILRDEVTLDDALIRAVAIAGPRHKTCILVNKSHYSFGHPDRIRFTLAHELCHLLFDRAYGTYLAMASGPWAPPRLEARANAFAAMFLMTPEVVKAAIEKAGGEIHDVADAQEVAHSLGTSFLATVEHLRNLGHLTSEQRNRLEEERSDGYQ